MVTAPRKTASGHGQAATPFGPCLIGWADEKICFLHFIDHHARDTKQLLKKVKPAAAANQNDLQAQAFVDRIFDLRRPGSMPLASLEGTPFQLKVWNALQTIPAGTVMTYGALAQSMGHPGAARAVGTAIAANQIGFLVPCHRVVRADGQSGQYRWGPDRKSRIIEWETSALARSPAAN